jgi:hypothetical protein
VTKQENRQRQDYNRDKILDLLKISQQEYYRIQFDLAEEYLMEFFQGNVRMVMEYMSTPAFWSWWRSQYTIIDHEFWMNVSDDNEPWRLMKGYRTVHKMTSIFPSRTLYHKVMDNVKSKKHEQH